VSADPLALALRQLNRRERSVGELRAYLLKRVQDEPAIEHALAELIREGYLDDERYARLFTADRVNLDGWGSQRIRRALQERGIAREHIDAAVGELDEEQEAERARELLQQRLRAPAHSQRERERAAGLLLRRGYSGEVTWRAIESFNHPQSAG
jgi:regulatory protein